MSVEVGGSHLVVDSVTVNATAVIYSNSLNLQSSKFFGLRIQCISASSTPDIKVEWESSNDPPSTEGSSDTNYVVPDGLDSSTDPIYANITNEVWRTKQFFPSPSNYGRLKITGNAANPSDTVVVAEIWLQG